MTALHPDLLTALDAIAVDASNRFVVAGEMIDAQAGVSALGRLIYARIYGAPSPSIGGRTSSMSPRAGEALVRALSLANGGRGTWDVGFVVSAIDGELIVVERDGVKLWVTPEELRARGQPRPGEPCRVRVGKELRALFPGFYTAIGDGDPRDETFASERAVRLYWHVTSEGAVPLMRELTAALNGAQIPFRFKILSDPGLYVRRDAGVLQWPKRCYHRALPLVARVHAAVRGWMRPEAPPFTKPLAHGLGFAEPPGTGESFGEHRSRVLAEGVLRAVERGAVSPEARCATVAEVLEERGVDPERPYLAIGSSDVGSSLGAEPSAIVGMRCEDVPV